MGSTESKKYDIPKSAYADLSNKHKESKQTFTSTIYQTRSVQTEHCVPSNLTIKQQQIIDNAEPDWPDNSEKSDSTMQQRKSTNYIEFDDNYPMACTCEEHQPHDLMKQVNISLEKSVPYDNAKKTPVTEEIPDNTKTSVISIEKQKLLKSIKPPSRLNDLNDFIENWNIWKEQFISFVTLMDELKENYQQKANILLHFMGPVSREILNELFFDKEENKKDYAILFQKFNALYEFYTTLKLKGEDTVQYIERLKEDIAPNLKNVDIMIKNKIAREIEKQCKERFVALAKSKLPKFKFETTFKSLTLAEISFLWKNCEEYDSDRSCINCGQFHQEGKCFAYDHDCSKCKNRGHFAKYCVKFAFITNCSFCGGSHEYKHCPSYGQTCSKCGHLNHFSWSCPINVLLKNCRYCGQSHLMSMSKCPANNHLCRTCGQRGHYEKKCTKIQNIVQKFEVD